MKALNQNFIQYEGIQRAFPIAMSTISTTCFQDLINCIEPPIQTLHKASIQLINLKLHSKYYMLTYELKIQYLSRRLPFSVHCITLKSTEQIPLYNFSRSCSKLYVIFDDLFCFMLDSYTIYYNISFTYGY